MLYDQGGGSESIDALPITKKEQSLQGEFVAVSHYLGFLSTVFLIYSPGCSFATQKPRGLRKQTWLSTG